MGNGCTGGKTIHVVNDNEKKEEDEKTVTVTAVEKVASGRRKNPRRKRKKKIKNVFGPSSEVIWAIIASFFEVEFIVETLGTVNKAIRGFSFLSFQYLELDPYLEKERIKPYKCFLKNRYKRVHHVDTWRFKKKKSLVGILRSLKQLEKLTCRLTKSLINNYLASESKTTISHLETDFRSNVFEFIPSLKSKTIKKLTILSIESGQKENFPIQTLMDNLKSLTVLELICGWNSSDPHFKHDKIMELSASSSNKNQYGESQYIEEEEENEEEGEEHEERHHHVHELNLLPHEYIRLPKEMSHDLDEYLPSLKKLRDCSGSFTLQSSSLQSLECFHFGRLNESLKDCQNLKELTVDEGAIESDALAGEDLHFLRTNKVHADLPSLWMNCRSLRALVAKHTERLNTLEGKKKFTFPELRSIDIQFSAIFPSGELQTVVDCAPKLEIFQMGFNPPDTSPVGTPKEEIRGKEPLLKIISLVSKSLVKIKLTEAHHPLFPVYFEIPFPKLYKNCKKLKTVHVVLNRGEKNLFVSRHNEKEHRPTWIADRRIFTRRPSRKLVSAEKVKKELERRMEEVRKSGGLLLDLGLVDRNLTPQVKEEKEQEKKILQLSHEYEEKNPVDLTPFEIKVIEEANKIMERKKNEGFLEAQKSRKRRGRSIFEKREKVMTEDQKEAAIRKKEKRKEKKRRERDKREEARKAIAAERKARENDLLLQRKLKNTVEGMELDPIIPVSAEEESMEKEKLLEKNQALERERNELEREKLKMIDFNIKAQIRAKSHWGFLAGAKSKMMLMIESQRKKADEERKKRDEIKKRLDRENELRMEFLRLKGITEQEKSPNKPEPVKIRVETDDISYY